MIHTKEEIIILAQKIMRDLDKEYYKDDMIVKVSYNEKDKVARPIGETINAWTISINSLLDSREFLLISDETAEPLYYQNSSYVIHEIGKNSEGIYYRKSNE